MQRLLIISPKGNTYKSKSSGPKINPWGTPQVGGLSLIKTKKLSAREIRGELVEAS